MTDRDHIPLHKSDCALLIGGYQCTCGFHQRQNKTLTALAAEQPKPSEDIEALRRDAYQGGWLREWLDSNGLLARAIRGESLAGYEHPDIKALRRDAERLADENERLNAIALQAQNAAIDLTKKNERLREALEIIAGYRQCVDPLMGNQDVAIAALRRERT